MLLDCCPVNENNKIFKNVICDKSRTEFSRQKFLLNLVENRSKSHQASEGQAEFLFGFACDPRDVAFAHVRYPNSSYTYLLTSTKVLALLVQKYKY
jgi:hypothetical protein